MRLASYEVSAKVTLKPSVSQAQSTVRPRLLSKSPRRQCLSKVGEDLKDSLLFAYGCTGSGKTHSMVKDRNTKCAGIVPRVLDALLGQVSLASRQLFHPDGRNGYTISSRMTSHAATALTSFVSYKEMYVYNNIVYDLLQDGDKPLHPQVQHVYLASVREVEVLAREEGLEICTMERPQQTTRYCKGHQQKQQPQPSSVYHQTRDCGMHSR